MLFKDLLGKKTLFFDGAMGTMLQAAGLKPGELPELWNFTHADEVEKIHAAYLNAGADIIKTNTFGANRLKFAGTDIKTADVVTQAVKIAKNFFPAGYMDDMKDMTVSFNKTSKMGGRSNIAQYEHTKRKISVTDEYTYADPKLTGAYLIHEFVHGKDNDPYTSIREEQDAYRKQCEFWIKHGNGIEDPEMDFVVGLYKKSAEDLDRRVAEVYRLRDKNIPETSYNHPPSNKKISATTSLSSGTKPLKAYDIIA